jgi:hypothetical protein
MPVPSTLEFAYVVKYSAPAAVSTAYVCTIEEFAASVEEGVGPK